MKNIVHDERGTAALEAALVFPLYLAFIFAIVEFGYIYWTFNNIQYLADEMSRCYAVGTCNDTNRGTMALNSAANIWPSATAAATEISAVATACGNSFGTGVRVTIIHSMTSTPASLLTGYFKATPFD